MAAAMSTTTPPRKASPARIISPMGPSAAISTGRASAASSARSRSGSTIGTSCASARHRVMTGVDIVTVRPEDGAGRLDRWFRRHYPALNHGRLEKLLRTGQIRVDGKRARAGDAVEPGQAIRVPPLAEPSTRSATPQPPRRIRPEDEELLRRLVLYRDATAIVINKPAGLAVQGGT